MNDNLQVKATHFCKTCEDPEALCGACAKQHTRQKLFREHQLCGEIQDFSQHLQSIGYVFLGNLNKKVFILTNTYSRPKFTCPSPFCDFFFTIVQLITMRWKNLRFFLFTHVFTRRNYHDQNYISYGDLYFEIVDSFHHLEVTRNTVQIFQRYYLGSFFSVARLDPCGRIYF